uniref:polynucleotide adenylyltransferase n=1 Tax=Romanomermis culicivorax TaxID=13658 RepID=A0A915KZH2_ROMCU
MERYMCSRFFIDFGRLDQQERKLRAYLDDHLISYPSMAKMDFLHLLYDVVDSGTVCLMNHERRASLQMIGRLCAEMQNALSSSATPPPTLVPPQQATPPTNQNFFFISGAGHQTPPILQASPILLEDNHGNYLLDEAISRTMGGRAPSFLSQPPPPVATTAFYFMPQQNATFFVPVV